MSRNTHPVVRVTVRLNGTDENPYHRWGLTQNPFPQIARTEYAALDRLLNNLAAEPIRDEAHLRERMRGADQAFVDECCRRFRKGAIAEFVLEFPDA